MTRRIISADEYDSNLRANTATGEPGPPAGRREPRSFIDPSFIVEIDRIGQPVGEFNDCIVVI